ncbi:MAG: formylmethanofuran dehydrogenase subunit C [Acidobacteriota bacterium]|jgi:formylmethanofuran dehydrogenase subunit C
MDELVLTYKGSGGSGIPLEAEAITPDNLRGKERGGIERLPLFHGNTKVPLGDAFEVKGDPSDRLRVLGDLALVKSLGQEMTGGRLVIEGNAGMHVGARMSGGTIEVRGGAADWAGAEMTGGLIWIKGDAGNRAGSAYRGSKYGMRGGVILIEGSAGHEVGGYMRRGLIAVRGDVQDFAGARMSAGTIFVFGRPGIRTGGGMKRGTIVCYQPPEVLPTFRAAGSFEPLFVAIYLRALAARGFDVGRFEATRRFARYRGDLAELGKGEILVAQPD